MKKYTANYTYTNPNFVIQNLVENPIKSDLLPILSFLKHILQREVPANLSKYLQSQIGDIYQPRNFNEKILEEKILTDDEVSYCFPTAVIRFQILIIELLTHNYLQLNGNWNFNILFPSAEELEIFEEVTYRDEIYGLVQIYGKNNALELAINDLIIEIDNLFQPKNKKIPEKQNFNINTTINKDGFLPNRNAINIDFSLFKKYDEKNNQNQDIIYLRTD